jgi:hypothetical protein
MTGQHDLDRQLTAFLREGPEELPDVSFDAVRDRTEQTRQRVVVGPWRFSIMNKVVTYGLGGAAVLAIALVVGAQVFGSPRGGLGTDPTATPEPTVTQAPTATPGRRGLPDGPYLLFDDPTTGARVTITIAAPEWLGTPGQGFVEWGPSGAEGPTGAGMIAFTEGEYFVYGDPCAWSTTKPERPASTVDDLMAALADQELRQASAPEDITVDGHSGKKIILRMADEVTDFDACDESGGDPTFSLFGVQTGPEDPARYSQTPGQVEEIWAVDVDGHLVLYIGAYYAETPEHAIGELRAILASAVTEYP